MTEYADIIIIYFACIDFINKYYHIFFLLSYYIKIFGIDIVIAYENHTQGRIGDKGCR